MHIRVANDYDVAVVREMGNKVLAHHASFNHFYKPVTGDSEITSSPEKIIFVATDNTDTVVGYIQGIFYCNPQDRSYPFAVIQSIWVDEIARGQGFAQSLISTFEEAVKQKGAKQIDLFVDLRNSLGLKLWDGAGYETYQEKRRKLI